MGKKIHNMQSMKRIMSEESTDTIMDHFPLDIVMHIFYAIEARNAHDWLKQCDAFSRTCHRFEQLWLSLCVITNEKIKHQFSRWIVHPVTTDRLYIAVRQLRLLFSRECYTLMAIDAIPSLHAYVHLYDKITQSNELFATQMYDLNLVMPHLKRLYFQWEYLSMAQRLRIIVIYNEFAYYSRSLSLFELSKPHDNTTYHNLCVYQGEYHSTDGENRLVYEGQWLDVEKFESLSQVIQLVNPVNIYTFNVKNHSSKGPGKSGLEKHYDKLTKAQCSLVRSQLMMKVMQPLIDMSRLDYSKQPKFVPPPSLPTAHRIVPFDPPVIGQALATIQPGERGRIQFSFYGR